MVTKESLIAEAREAKAVALEQRSLKDIKAANQLLKALGDAGSVSEQEEAELALIVELDCVDTALYRHFDKAGALLYVGISISHIKRLCEHRDRSSWYKDIATVTIQWFKSRSEAIAAERHAITSEKPRHNVIGNNQDASTT